jgi:rhodanese-related sulfurtransferase
VSTIHTLSPALLAPLLQSGQGPLILDVRRRRAFEQLPTGLPGALPIYLDEDPIRLPDVDRERTLVAYCL